MSLSHSLSYKKLNNSQPIENETSASTTPTRELTETDMGIQNNEEKSPLTRARSFPTMSPGWNYGTVNSEKRHSSERAISKKGLSNLTPTNIEQNHWAFFSDMFTTFLEVKWRWLMFAFCFAYFSSWFVFAIVWYLILYVNDDLNPVKNKLPTYVPCITNIDNFTTAFLFSVETMQTTGYGYYHITDKCPSAIITLCVQSIFGIILEGLMVGLVFVKMGRAKKRSATLMFSRNAVISRRDGCLCFMFRVADMRNKSHLLDARIRAQFVGRRITLEGEEISISQQEIQVHGDGEKSNKILLFWPTTIIHIIDKDSPLAFITPEDLTSPNISFEIVVVLEGIVEATGLMTQARSSYMPSEILWNYRFKNIAYNRSSKTGDKILDYAHFHETYPVPK